MLWKHGITVFGKRFHVSFRVSDEKTVYVAGFGSRTEDGRHILLLDYDGVPYEWIVAEIRFLQEEHKLGHCFVFSTKRGHHCVFLEKYGIGAIVELMGLTSCDSNFKSIPLQRAQKLWVLRSFPKKQEVITYKERISCFGCERERSHAHQEYLRTMYKVPLKDFEGGGAFDVFSAVPIAAYKISEQTN